jgi:hypothetical protein
MIHFSTWMWDQIDMEGPYMAFSKVCWDDVNNGCAHVKFTPQEWLKHFDERHPTSSRALKNMLIPAYLNYMTEVQ